MSNLTPPPTLYPEGADLQRQINRRNTKGKVGKTLFFLSTSFALLVLIALLLNIINSVFGYTAVTYKQDPQPIWQSVGKDVGTTSLAQLDSESLLGIIRQHLNTNQGRALEEEQLFTSSSLLFVKADVYNARCQSAEPFTACSTRPRSTEQLRELVEQRILQPKLIKTWSLWQSITNKQGVDGEFAELLSKTPQAQLHFRNWLSADFIGNAQASNPLEAGIWVAIQGSLFVVLVTIFASFPIGVAAAIYLEEYANKGHWLTRLIQTNISNLAGVPSIIYGMLGLAIFVRLFQTLTSGLMFGFAQPDTANGSTILSAGLTLSLLILPLIIINAQEAIRAVPSSLRQASFGLGATKWQTIWHHVLPNALPGILTGAILAVSRAIGETAPVVVVGASTFIATTPLANGPLRAFFSKFTILPIQIYDWTTRPQAGFANISAASIIVLLVLLLSLNATAVILRNRFSKQLK